MLKAVRRALQVAMSTRVGTGHSATCESELYRADGVRITHDPFAPGMAEKYGPPGRTDDEGFDPYKDTVGPGIYGGVVKRDQKGDVVIGRQYQNHNSRPGPVYAGGGYAPSSKSLDDVRGKLVPLLRKYPDLSNDVTTGGAAPLHMCGMSRSKQDAVAALVQRGADIEALDTYGMTPLHRMASNNLAAGAAALLAAGADPEYEGKIGSSPLQIAKESRAADVIRVLAAAPGGGRLDNVERIQVLTVAPLPVSGNYLPQSPALTNVPEGFRKVCQEQQWDFETMWKKLNGVDPRRNIWFKHEENESYIYFNQQDRKWWIDGPDGLGVFIVRGPAHAPPAHGWTAVSGGLVPPLVMTFRSVESPSPSSSSSW